MFEGSEKKLELILKTPVSGLRNLKGHPWDTVVQACGAEVINRMTTPAVDAYLLSASSLFVWDDRILMITCGQTTPVASLGPILERVGVGNVAVVFYERKNMIDPSSQPCSFADDRRQLSHHFQGQIVCLGSSNGDHVEVFYARPRPTPCGPDVTLQILMHDLDPGAEATFTAGSAETCRIPPIDRIIALFPDMQLDQHFFAPCGYSLNGVAGAHYGTVHVTPQKGGSYASLETNRPGVDIHAILHVLTEVFQPGRFSTLRTTRTGTTARALDNAPFVSPSEDYRCTNTTRADLDGDYAMTFRNYSTRTTPRT